MKNILVRIGLPVVMLFCLCSCLEQDNQGAGLIDEARSAYVKGYYSQARDVYENYLKNYPQGEYRFESWNRLIDISVIMHNNLDKGIELTEAMLLELSQDKEKSFLVLDKLGDLYQAQGNLNKALESWQKCFDVIVLNPKDQAGLYLKMAKVYREMASYDFAMESLSDCIQICDQARDSDVNSTDDNGLESIKIMCMYQLAQNAMFIQNWDYAETILTNLAQMQKIDEETKSLAYFMLADVYEHKREFDKAREILEQIKDTYPNPYAVKARLKVLGK